MADTEDNARKMTTDALFRGSLALPYFGVVLFVAWIFLVLFSPTFDFLPSSYSEAEGSAYVWSSAFLILTMVATAIWTKPLTDFYLNKPMQVFIPVLMLFGTVCYAYGYRNFGAPWDIVGGIATGVPSAAMAICWVYEYAGIDVKTLLLNLQWLVVSSIVFCLILLYLPSVAITVIVVLLPIGSGLCLSAVNGLRGPDIVRQKDVVKNRWLGYVYIAVIVGVIGLASGIFNGGENGVGQAYSFATVFGCIIVLGLFAAAGIFVYGWKRELFFSAYLMPTIVLVLVLIPSVHSITASPSVAFVAMGENLGEIALEVALLVLSAVYARYLRVGAIGVFCTARISMAICDLVGYWALPALGVDVSSWPVLDQLGVFTVLLLVEFGMVCLLAVLLLKRRDTAPLEEAMREVDELPDAGGKGRDGDAPVPSAKAGTDDAGDTGASAVPPAPTRREVCEEIGSAYGLSERELDVLELLSKGYPSSAIQEKLYIAAGTVNSHTRNIYAKLGVHTKNEVIELVENWARKGTR